MHLSLAIDQYHLHKKCKEIPVEIYWLSSYPFPNYIFHSFIIFSKKNLSGYCRQHSSSSLSLIRSQLEAHFFHIQRLVFTVITSFLSNEPARLKPKLKFFKQLPSNVIDTKSSKMYLTADHKQTKRNWSGYGIGKWLKLIFKFTLNVSLSHSIRMAALTLSATCACAQRLFTTENYKNCIWDRYTQQPQNKYTDCKLLGKGHIKICRESSLLCNTSNFGSSTLETVCMRVKQILQKRQRRSHGKSARVAVFKVFLAEYMSQSKCICCKRSKSLNRVIWPHEPQSAKVRDPNN